MRWHRVALALFGLAILALALYLVGGRDTLAAMRRVQPWALAGAALAIAISTVLGAYNVHRTANLAPAIGFGSFLPVFWKSWAVGISLPGQVADMIATVWQLRGRVPLDFGFISGRLVADKAITLYCSLMLAALIPWSLQFGPPAASAWLLLALVVAGPLAWWALAWLSERLPPGHRLLARLRPVLRAVSAPIPVLAANAAITALKLALGGLAYWLMFSSMQPVAPGYATTTILAQSAGLIAYLPISFNGLGTVEVSAISLFGAAGVSPATVLSAYLLLRAVTLTLAWLPALWWGVRANAR